MKINKVKISGFKAIKDLEYTPEHKLAVLCAENGKGKTSFLEALRFGITGEAPNDCINDDAESATVAIDMDDVSFARTKHREKPTKVLLNKKTTTGKNLDIILSDATGVTRDVSKIITSQDVVASMKPDELGSFLMRYIPETLDFDTIVSYIPGIESHHISLLADYLPPMPITFGMNEVRAAYEQLFAARSYAKKDKYSRDAQIDASLEMPPPRTLEDIINEERDIFAKEGSQKAATAAKALYDAAITNKERVLKMLESIKKEIDENKSTKPINEQLENIVERKSELNRSVVGIQALIHTLRGNISMFKNTLENLNKPVCPISEGLVCTTDKRPIKKELEEMIASNEEGIAIQQQLLKEANEGLSVLAVEEARWRENAKFYDQKLQLIRRYEEQKKNIPEVPACPSVVTAIVDYTERKRELAKEKDYCERYNRNLKLMSESALFGEQYDALNFLCTALEPKGDVMGAITAYYLADFESVINDRADALGLDYKVKLENNEGIIYTVKTPHATVYRPYDNLSNGEKILAIVLLLDMLNSLCGLRLLLIDDANHLDSNNISCLFDLLHNPTLQDDYDHIFVSSAANADVETAISTHTDIDRIM